MTMKKTTLFLFFAFMSISSLISVPAALAQQEVQSRLNRIENEIQTLSRALFRGEAPPPEFSQNNNASVNNTAQANTDLRLSQIEIEIRTLTGRVEELSFDNQQLRRDIKALQSEIISMGRASGGNSAAINDQTPTMALTADDFIMPAQSANTNTSDIGGTLGTLPVISDAQNDRGQPVLRSNAAIPEQPAAFYDMAFSLLKQKDFEQSAQLFESFVAQFPEHNLAGNAKYWLGETFYVRGQFDRAAREFAGAYQSYPNGPKGPDNLLKLGMSLDALGKTEDACLSFAQLLSEYANAPTGIIVRARAEIDRLSCP